jgi:hypothetical protein
MDRRIAQDKIIGFALGLGKQDRTATGIDFSGDVDTKQYTLSIACFYDEYTIGAPSMFFRL